MRALIVLFALTLTACGRRPTAEEQRRIEFHDCMINGGGASACIDAVDRLIPPEGQPHA